MLHAPAEAAAESRLWFSELYAAWKLGKLKDEHPAVGWLKTLKI